jgi:hypothetical protein
MSQVEQPTGSECIPRLETLTAEYLRDILDDFCMSRWNGNRDTVAAVGRWKDWPLVVRMADVRKDFTILIDNGLVRAVTVGLPQRPRMVCVMFAETMQRIYYQETTVALESIAGRIGVRGNEIERRRLLTAMSYLTW